MDNELLTKTQLEAWNNSFEISTLKKQISRDTDYHNRLEQEVTSLKRANILLETQNTQLAHDLKRAQEIIKERNEMLEDNTYEKRLEDMISMLGSEVIKKETTIWERNALLIIVTSLSAIALTYLIFVL